jgi:hypothetical protein
MLPASIRFKLHFGPSARPRFKLGAIVEDEIRGQVTIVGLTDARIPWPIGRKGKYRALLVEATLARAIRRESVQAVAYWWGISTERVRVFRRALDVPVNNEGSSRLRKRYAETPAFRRTSRKAWANSGSPERRAKMSAVKLGTTLPESARRKIAAANRRRIVTAESCQKMSKAVKKLWAERSRAERRWTPEEIALLKELSNAEVAGRTGRTMNAIRHRRRILELAQKHSPSTQRRTKRSAG